jgi:RNA polymerase sigma-70 factor (ECF subfamily)
MKYTVSQQAILDEWGEIQAAQQNPAAFAPLYDRYYEAIFRFVYQRILDMDLSEDLVSEVFIKAMQKIKDYQFQGLPFSAWLFRIARNEVAQHYRQSKRKRVVAIEDSGLREIQDELSQEQGNAIQAKEQFEVDVVKLQNLLQELEPDDMLLVEMRFFEKRPFKEIAEILELTESNAKVRLYRLLERLKQAFLRRGGQR